MGGLESGQDAGEEEPGGGHDATHDGDEGEAFESGAVFGGGVHGGGVASGLLWCCGYIITITIPCNSFLQIVSFFIMAIGIPGEGRGAGTLNLAGLRANRAASIGIASRICRKDLSETAGQTVLRCERLHERHRNRAG